MNKPTNRDKVMFGWLQTDKCYSATPHASQLIEEVLRIAIHNNLITARSTQRLRRLR